VRLPFASLKDALSGGRYKLFGIYAYFGAYAIDCFRRFIAGVPGNIFSDSGAE